MKEFMKKLYDEKLRFNAAVQKATVNNIEYNIIYIGTSDFIIINNFYGVVAVGSRSLAYGLGDQIENINIYYEIKEPSVSHSTIETICKKYERLRLKHNYKIKYFYEGEF